MKWTEFIDRGAWFVMGFMMTFGLMLLWNTNHKYPPKPVQPVSAIDKHSIVTRYGECWVVMKDEKGLLTEFLFHGGHVEECTMYLENLKL